MSDPGKLIKSNQDQAVAAWIGHLKQLRLESLLNALSQQDGNFRDALDSVDAAIKKAGEVVVSNRGGLKGMHGFLAEVAEVGIGNARSAIFGEHANYEWVNDNGPVDLIRSGVPIQQKFVAAGGRLGLGAIAEHLEKYPDFIRNGGRYQIPRDHFETIQLLHTTSAEEAGKFLSRSGDGPSFTDWRRVQSFFSTGSIEITALEPSSLDYRDVQRETFRATLNAEKASLGDTDRNLRNIAHEESRPTLSQGARVTVAAAGIEGGTAFVLAVAKKRSEGKKLKEFTSADWVDVMGQSSIGLLTGGVRGLSIFSLTNFAATSAAAANTIAVAAFGIAEQANKLRRGEISEVQFVEKAELVCLEAGVSALSASIGQAVIPIPILGAVIGNTVGMIIYNTVSSSLSENETALLERYLKDQRDLDEQLAVEYSDLVDKFGAGMSRYLQVLELAFSPDIEVAMMGSVDLARFVGVAPSHILDTDEKVQSYFLD